nr:hypothetical protein [Tanacetum cinerariifolium]
PTNTDPVDTTRKDAEQSGRTITLIIDDMRKKKNDVKARTTLLLSLPDEHQLRNDLDSLPLLALPFPLVVLMLPQLVKTLLVPILLLSPMVLRFNLRTSTRLMKTIWKKWTSNETWHC